MCERPLTMTSAEAKELQRLSVENGVFLMEAMWTKFTPAMRKVADLLDSDVLGEPRLMQAGCRVPRSS